MPAAMLGKQGQLEQRGHRSFGTEHSERTRGIVAAAELAAMKPTALLVNTSRGPTVDTPAPLAALRERRIAGAALDVYDAEPLPVDDPLHTTPGLLATPHIGYVTRDPYTTFYRDAVEDIAAFLNGTPVRVLAALHTRRPNHTPSTQRSPQTAPSPEK